jgi:hypothetical protein
VAPVSSVSSAMGSRQSAAQELALPAHHVQRLRGRGLVGEGEAAGGDDPSGGHTSIWMIVFVACSELDPESCARCLPRLFIDRYRSTRRKEGRKPAELGAGSNREELRWQRQLTDFF